MRSPRLHLVPFPIFRSLASTPTLLTPLASLLKRPCLLSASNAGCHTELLRNQLLNACKERTNPEGKIFDLQRESRGAMTASGVSGYCSDIASYSLAGEPVLSESKRNCHIRQAKSRTCRCRSLPTPDRGPERCTSAEPCRAGIVLAYVRGTAAGGNPGARGGRRKIETFEKVSTRGQSAAGTHREGSAAGLFHL